TPLFIEETVRSLIESGNLSGDADLSTNADGLKSVKIPPTVQEVIAARIDRLTLEQKSILQAASVVGVEVPTNLLRLIASVPENQFAHLLADLEQAEFIYQDPSAPLERFMFRHALTHEVAYNSLLRSKRQALHAQLVSAIEQQYRDRL